MAKYWKVGQVFLRTCQDLKQSTDCTDSGRRCSFIPGNPRPSVHFANEPEQRRQKIREKHQKASKDPMDLDGFGSFGSYNMPMP